MKINVIHHSADFDGLFCREIAKKFYGDKAEYIGWDYGQPIPEVAKDITLVMLDISVDGLMDHPNLIWIDHHKSAMDKWNSPHIPGIRIDGVAACRLAWQFFFLGDDHTCLTKKDFLDRDVDEPLAVRLAGEYDIWDKRDPRAELFQHGLRSCDLTNQWSSLLAEDRKLTIKEIEDAMATGFPVELEPDGTTAPVIVCALLQNGRSIQYAKTEENKGIIESYGFDLKFEGLHFLACNHARFNSHLFTAGIKPEHDALLGFNFDGSKWRVSLYHAPSKEHHDLSQIAVKYGGGGHRGACGFKLDSLTKLNLT
jgi:uncharacterized protein